MTGAPLDQHRLALEAQTESLLRDYLVRCSASSNGRRGKEFNDPLWGTLQIKAAEVVVIDSPLLQRLRRIRQLGVAHLVYPAAVHTRLEHSLGVAHQVQQLADSIAAHAWSESGTPPVLHQWHVSLLRMGAICHDVGHGFMSHVSENALDNNRHCGDLRLAFQDVRHKTRRNQLSEIAAFYMVGSPAFRELLALAEELAPTDLPLIKTGQTTSQKLDMYQELLQKLIVSEVVDPEYPLLHELISGPFDADKLDYMPRDAALCGVPVVTDVARLIAKVRAVNVGWEQVPTAITASAERRDQYAITGIARSGARTLDELALGRALLFDKIYRHQKVRAAEAMVASIVAELLEVVSEQPAMLPYRLSDEELLGLTVATATEALGMDGLPLDEEQLLHLNTAVDLAKRLRERRLLARGFAFSSKMPMDPYRNDAEQRVGVDALSRDAREPRRRAELAAVLLEVATDIARRTGHASPASVVPHGVAAPYVWISPPVVSDGSGESNEIGHAWLIGQHGEEIRRAEEEYAETRGWSDAYVATRDLGLIFCPAEIAPAMYLAAEAVVRDRYQLRVPTTMLAFAKQSREVIEKMRSQLAIDGFYDHRPVDLLPTPPVLARGDADARLDAVLKKLTGYSGPLMVDASTGKFRDSAMTRERLRDWLKQFRLDARVDGALTALEHLQVIGRHEVDEALKHFLETHPNFHGASVCPLGEPKDSSSVITYYAEDVAREYGCKTRSLTDALLCGGPVIFVDDYVGRGSAAITVLENWLDAEDSQNLGQERSEPLSEMARGALADVEIALVFVVGRNAGRERLQQRTVDLALRATTWIHNGSLPALDSLPLPVEGDRVDLIEFCSERGREALEAEGRPAEWVADRTLGYGNEGVLVVSTYNTPTAAPTCFWHDGPEWRALFPRRKKR